MQTLRPGGLEAFLTSGKEEAWRDTLCATSPTSPSATIGTPAASGSKVDAWLIAGSPPQRRFTAHLDIETRKIRIELAADGKRMVSCRQRQDGRQTPIIGICNGVIERIFGTRDRARVTYAEGRIEISLHHLDQRAEERAEKIAEIRSGNAIQVGSLCTGGGILDNAVHTGIDEAGLQAKAAFTVEVEGRYVEAHIENNCALAGAVTLQGSIDEIEPALLPRIHLLTAGRPRQERRRPAGVRPGSRPPGHGLPRDRQGNEPRRGPARKRGPLPEHSELCDRAHDAHAAWLRRP